MLQVNASQCWYIVLSSKTLNIDKWGGGGLDNGKGKFKGSVFP